MTPIDPNRNNNSFHPGDNNNTPSARVNHPGAHPGDNNNNATYSYTSNSPSHGQGATSNAARLFRSFRNNGDPRN